MFWKSLIFQLQSFFIMVPGVGQQVPLQLVGELPKGIDESSGLALLRSGQLVQINDSGNPPCIFFTDSIGNLLELDCPEYLKNEDWEDLAYGNDYLFIGDFGNNRNLRHQMTIYRVSVAEDLVLENAGSIKFSYNEQSTYPPAEYDLNYDVEAMFYDRDSLFLFTKNRTNPFSGYTYLYGMPATPGEYQLTRLDSLRLGAAGKQQHWVTGADLNPSGNIMALLGYDQMWLFYNFEEGKYLRGRVVALQFDAISQKESICFDGDSTLVISDERNPIFKGGRVYRLYLLEKYFKSAEMMVQLTSGELLEDQIRVRISGEATLPILWEIFTVDGERPLFGKIASPVPANKSHELVIDASGLAPGGYVLSIIIADRPYAYKLKKRIK